MHPIEKYRRKFRLTLADLGRILKVHPSALSRIERCIRPLTIKKAMEWSVIIGVPWQELLAIPTKGANILQQRKRGPTVRRWCLRGHPMTSVNVGKFEGVRYCRKCRKISRDKKGTRRLVDIDDNEK